MTCAGLRIMQKINMIPEDRVEVSLHRLDLKLELSAQWCGEEVHALRRTDLASIQARITKPNQTTWPRQLPYRASDRAAASDDQGKIDSGALTDNGQSHFNRPARRLGCVPSY